MTGINNFHRCVTDFLNLLNLHLRTDVSAVSFSMGGVLRQQHLPTLLYNLWRRQLWKLHNLCGIVRIHLAP